MANRRKHAGELASPIVIIVILVVVIISAILNRFGVWDSLLEDAAPSGSTSVVDSDDVIMTAHFIDIGQGDCSLFISGGETMLIDCGEAEYSDKVITDLESYGVKKLNYVVVTHAHSDHMGGMANIIDAMPTENIIISEPSDKSSTTATYERFLDAIDRSDAEVILAEPDYTFTLGSAECTVLAPFEVSDNEENNNSVVMRIEAGETSFLMTGDAEKAVEKQIINEYPDLEATILKVGHHGSRTSTSVNFLELIRPEAAVISVGAGNSYGHPTDEILENLEGHGVKYYRTDISGTVTVTCTLADYKITTQK